MYDVCVVIPCYNNHEGLADSLRSIHYPNDRLCIVVVDDGSIPMVQQEELSTHTSYLVQLLRNEKNSGITTALNTALSWISQNLKVRYLARLDCADICSPQRFVEQVSFLDSHPHIGLLGSWCTFKNPETGFEYAYTTPTQHPDIMREMHFRCVFIHPTVMFRASLLQKIGFYPVGFPFVEDYAFFYKMLSYTQGAVLNRFLVTCELNPLGISVSNRAEQLTGRARVVAAFGNSKVLKFLGVLKINLMKAVPYKAILALKKETQ